MMVLLPYNNSPCNIIPVDGDIHSTLLPTNKCNSAESDIIDLFNIIATDIAKFDVNDDNSDFNVFHKC